jgi:hypothetical protein
MRKVRRARATTPPTTPPMMGATFVDEELSLLGDEVAEALG